MVDSTIGAGHKANTVGAAIGVNRTAVTIVGILIALRFVAAIYLPLSFDESYFWLWSKHLAVSYYDHPPLIALAIKLGTLIFGDTQFGVRASSFAASIAASWAVWRAGAILLDDEIAGGIACCFFNATLMIASQGMGATPDSLVLAAGAFLLFAIARLQQSGDGRWWIAAGAALGAALLTKYTAFFLGAGTALWLVSARQGRIWLKTPWPYAAALIAVACFMPNLLWNASHDWISFKFQFGRTVAGAPTIRYLLEFAGGQLAMASPFILVLGIAGFIRETRSWPATNAAAIAAAIVWPALIYFTFHAIHDRVQGNWPSFAYPALAVLAASVWPMQKQRRLSLLGLSRLAALPMAFAILIAVYAQALLGIVALGIEDPIARMTAVGIAPVAADISALVKQRGAKTIVTSKYVTTGWLSFYLHPRLPVLQISEDYRWLQTPRADLKTLQGPLLYVTQHPLNELPLVTPHFSHIALDKTFSRMRSGAVVDKFYVYSLSGFHGAPVGRLPNALND